MLKRIIDPLVRFKMDLRNNRVDDLIIDLIITLNNNTIFTTTSSCSGRITVLCFSDIEQKKGSKRVAFHFIPLKDIFIKSITRVFSECPGYILVRVRGFVIDVKFSSISNISIISRKLSLKAVTIKPLKRTDELIIELKSHISLDIPLLEMPNDKLYDIVVQYLWRNFLDLSIFRSILWYTISENLSDDEATLK